jgi:hypothetical protein
MDCDMGCAEISMDRLVSREQALLLKWKFDVALIK